MSTLGEYRVGVSFNPGGSSQVDDLKRAAADLINAIGAIPDGSLRGKVASPEVMRLKALAMTAAEEAAMWAVKAATKPEPEKQGADGTSPETAV